MLVDEMAMPTNVAASSGPGGKKASAASTRVVDGISVNPRTAPRSR